MKVRALTSFSGLGIAVQKGQEFDLPKGADWVKAGLCEKIKEAPKKKKNASSD